LNSEEIAKVGFWGWLSKQESIRATRSRYGSRAFQISSQPGQSARFFNQIVDQAAVDKVAEEIANLKREKVDCEGPHTQLREDITKVATKLEQLTAEEVGLLTAYERLGQSRGSMLTHPEKAGWGDQSDQR
jgi:hypothetical protein